MKTFVLIALTFFTNCAWGKFLRVPYEGVRQLGMGNAFIALADDSNALWYNPAGLARIKGVHVNLLDINLGVDSADTFNRIRNAVSSGDYAELVRSDTQAMKAGSRPTFIAPYFGFTIFDSATAFSDMRNLESLDLEVDLYEANDIGVMLGFGIPAGRFFSIGASVKAIQRSSVDAHITGAELLEQVQATQADFLSAIYDNVKQLAALGWGVGVNVGALLEVPSGLTSPKVTFAATIEDVGGTKFAKLGNSQPRPAEIPASYHFGTAVQYTLGKSTVLNFTADVRNNFESIHWGKKVHMGMELRNRFAAVRAGLYQGYPTYGVSLEFPPHTRLHFATYESELTDTLRSRGQRWYVMQLTLGFNPF